MSMNGRPFDHLTCVLLLLLQGGRHVYVSFTLVKTPPPRGKGKGLHSEATRTLIYV